MSLPSLNKVITYLLTINMCYFSIRDDGGYFLVQILSTHINNILVLKLHLFHFVTKNFFLGQGLQRQSGCSISHCY